MKKWIFVLALVSVLFVFAGCASDETPEGEPVTEILANTENTVVGRENPEPISELPFLVSG